VKTFSSKGFCVLGHFTIFDRMAFWTLFVAHLLFNNLKQQVSNKIEE